MSLEGAKFICLDEAGNQGEIVLAKGRKFTVGYYVSCDFVLADERAKGVHCEIECDAFGRVTIRNLSPDKPILVNGSAVEIKRILLNNSKLSILDKEYLWLFPKGSSNEFEDLPIESASTPQKHVAIPEQPPNSCPDFKLHREVPKRFTVHNFAYCIQSDEEGNTSTDSNDDLNANEDNTQPNESHKADDSQTKEDVKSNEVINQLEEEEEGNNENLDSKDKHNRSITPEPKDEKDNTTKALMETPKMNLINCTKDKENKSTQKKSKQLLTMCHQSDVVITSFSPRETGVKIEKSFATIVKPKVLVTKTPATPKSAYSTPKGEMPENDVRVEDDKELMTFHTPSTSKKGSSSTDSTKVLKNSSMHLIDLTTPHKLRPASPFLKSALKASAKKNTNANAGDKSQSSKLSSEEQLGLCALPSTPVISEASNSPLETPNSVISVSSSTDSSSIIEVTSDGSNMGITPGSATGLTTPIKAPNRAGACTPKRTPQSLMKRALLTSAKKQNTTPQRNVNTTSAATTTPRRESINRIPLRSNLALLRSPSTPQASTGDKSNSQLPRRHSMSTPTRKSISAKNRFDSPTTTSLAPASPSTSNRFSVSRRASLNPISAARALPTSTPVSGSSNNSALRTRAACKTSPLHKVRKSIGGMPLTSHISKARRSIVLPASTSKITSIKEKSPQQVMSDRLVSRARKSLCVTPISARSRNMVTAAKTPPQPTPSILKDRTAQSARKPERKAVLFADKIPANSEVDDLSRTFIIDSDDEESTNNGKAKDKPKDATFSPDKDTNEINVSKMSTENEQPAIEIPVDVDEITDLTKNNSQRKIDNVKEENEKLEDDNNKKESIVTEESFAEIINDSQESQEEQITKTIEIPDSPKESSQTESQESFADVVEEIVQEDTTNDEQKSKEITKDNEKIFVVETGFGEESVLENIETNNKTKPDEEDKTAEEISNKNHRDKDAELTEKSEQIAEEDNVATVEIPSSTTEETNETVVAKTTTLDVQEVADNIVIEGEEQKSKTEYKPIVEDITLEGSLIEKEANVSKQPLYEDITLEGSVIEDKVKNEEVKPETTEDITKLPANSKLIESTENSEQEITKESEVSKLPKSDEVTQEQDIEISSNTQEPVCSTVEEKSKETKTVDVEVLEDNVKEPIENTEIIEKLESSAIGDDLENTNKLLEEIEDVLNKSDEIKQKHLSELEANQESDNPLTEEFESEKLTQEIKENSEETTSCVNEDKNQQEVASEANDAVEQETDVKNLNNEQKVQQNIQTSKEDDKIVQDVDKKEKTESQQENSTTNIESTNLDSKQDVGKVDQAQNENIPVEIENSSSVVEQHEVSEEIISQIKENTFMEENTESTVHTESEINENEKCKDEFVQNEENADVIASRSKENSNLNIQNKTEEVVEESEKNVEISETSEEVIENDDNLNTQKKTEIEKNIENLETSTQSLENVVSETADFSMNKENSETTSQQTVPEQETEIAQEKLTEMETVIVESGEKTKEETTHDQEKIVHETEDKSKEKHIEKDTEENFTIISKHQKDQSEEIKTEIVAQNEIQPEVSNIELVQKNNLSQNQVTDEANNEPSEHQTNKSKEKEDEISSIKKKIENSNSFTPRRSTRRASQSAETSQASTELSFTPRRSARRASMSAESTTTYTPTKRTTRRASLSVVNETPLTPKSITKRRPSISLDDDEIIRPSISKTRRAKTPRKQIEQRMVIPEEMEEVVGAAIIEEVEEPAEEVVDIGKKKRRSSISNTVSTSTTKTPLKKLEQNTVIPEENTVIVEFSDAAENKEIIKQKEDHKKEFEMDKADNLVTEGNAESALSKQTSKEISKENLEVIQIVEDNKQDDAKGTTHKTEEVTTDNFDQSKKEEEYINTDISVKPPQEMEEELKEGDEVDKVNLKDTAENEISKSHTDVEQSMEVKEIPQGLAETDDKEDYQKKTPTKQFTEETENSNINTPVAKKSVTIISSSPKTPLMVGMRELLKTPKAETQTPRLGGVRELVRSPKERSENEEDEIEKLAVVADLVKSPEASCSEKVLEQEISTPTTKKQVTIVAESPKTPLMSGMREMLKTPKAEAQTPRLGGIRELVRSPKDANENEQEEVEKLAVVADLVKTPKVTSSVPVLEQDISTPKTKKQVTIVAESPKTPLMSGMREMLKTPKAEAQTPRLGGIRELVRSPKDANENEQEEVEKLAVVADLVKTPKTTAENKQVTIEANSAQTPLMTGMRELLKTPKCEMNTPKLEGICELVKTPKSKTENEQEEMEKLDVPAELAKTPQVEAEEMPSGSLKNDNLKGVKELLKTPKSCNTPRFKGMRELMQTPKISSTPLMAGVKELLDSPTVQDNAEDVSQENTEELPCSTNTTKIGPNLKGVKELMKTPKSCSTPRLKGIRELMQTPKMSSTPLMGGLKELMDSPAQSKDEELEKYLRTPTAKNIMIPTMPSSAIIEKSSDSIEISTEYDLNATNEGETAHLEDLFKTPVASRFAERITASYYGEEGAEHDETLEKFTKTKNETLQDTINKSAEEAFDKMVGQESQIQTPIRKVYPRKSFALQTPQAQSPFTAADVLSDLPKTDVEEWIETLDQAEPPSILECDDDGEDSKQQKVEDDDLAIESLKVDEDEESSVLEETLGDKDKQDTISNDSVIPETCTKVFLPENTQINITTASLTNTDTKDPLRNTNQKPQKETRPVTPIDAEISGINLLDQTVDSAQDEPSILDEPLVVEEPSIFEEPLMVSDNESEADNTINKGDETEVLEVSQDDDNDLSEPLMVSDSEDLNQSQENEANIEVENKEREKEVSKLEVEKSIIVKDTNISLSEDPLETKDKEPETSVILVEEDEKSSIEINDSKHENEESLNQQKLESVKETFSVGDESLVIEDSETKESENKNEDIKICEAPKDDEIQSTSQESLIETDILGEESLQLEDSPTKEIIKDNREETENSLTDQTKETEQLEPPQINENLEAEIDAEETVVTVEDISTTNVQDQEAKEISIRETKVVSNESDDIFVDTSVTEICEETSTTNDEHIAESEEVTEQIQESDIEKDDVKKSSPQLDRECQDIFMDGSNIDESFADEENNADNESAKTKMSKDEDKKDDIKEEQTVKENKDEVVEVSSPSEKTTDFKNVTEEQHDVKETESTSPSKSDSESVTVVENLTETSLVSKEIDQISSGEIETKPCEILTNEETSEEIKPTNTLSSDETVERQIDNKCAETLEEQIVQDAEISNAETKEHEDNLKQQSVLVSSDQIEVQDAEISNAETKEHEDNLKQQSVLVSSDQIEEEDVKSSQDAITADKVLDESEPVDSMENDEMQEEITAEPLNKSSIDLNDQPSENVQKESSVSKEEISQRNDEICNIEEDVVTDTTSNENDNEKQEDVIPPSIDDEEVSTTKQENIVSLSDEECNLVEASTSDVVEVEKDSSEYVEEVPSTVSECQETEKSATNKSEESVPTVPEIEESATEEGIVSDTEIVSSTEEQPNETEKVSSNKTGESTTIIVEDETIASENVSSKPEEEIVCLTEVEEKASFALEEKEDIISDNRDAEAVSSTAEETKKVKNESQESVSTVLKLEESATEEDIAEKFVLNEEVHKEAEEVTTNEPEDSTSNILKVEETVGKEISTNESEESVAIALEVEATATEKDTLNQSENVLSIVEKSKEAEVESIIKSEVSNAFVAEVEESATEEVSSTVDDCKESEKIFTNEIDESSVILGTDENATKETSVEENITDEKEISKDLAEESATTKDSQQIENIISNKPEQSTSIVSEVEEISIEAKEESEQISEDKVVSEHVEEVSTMEEESNQIEAKITSESVEPTSIVLTEEESSNKKVTSKEVTSEEATSTVFEHEDKETVTSKESVVPIEIVKTYDFEIKINDVEKQPNEPEDVKEKPTTTQHNSKVSQSADANEETTAPEIESPEYEKIEVRKASNTPEVAIEESKVIIARSSRRKRTVSESSQDSAQGDEPSSSSRRDRRKVIKKTSEEKLEDVKEEVTPQHGEVKDEKPKRKRTTSESSQGSIKDEDISTTTRRTRRRVQKTPVEETVVEQKEEIEEPAPEETQISQQGEERESNIETKTEITVESNIVKNVPLEDVIMEQNEDISADVASNEEFKKEVSEPVENKQEVTQMTVDVQELVNEKEDENKPEVVKLEVAKESSIEDNLGKNQTSAMDVSEYNIVQTSADETKEVALKEELSELPKIKPMKIGEDETKSTETSAITAESSEVKDKGEIVKSVSLDTESITENVQEVIEAIVTDEPKELPVKRGRRKQTVSESSQGSLHGDERATAHTVKTRRKLQKVPAEEIVLEEPSIDTESNTVVVASNDEEVTLIVEKHDLETKPLVEQTQTIDSEIISTTDSEIVETESLTLEEIKEQTVKRGRRKPTVSESSQGSLHEDDTSRTRRGRRKIQKTPEETPVLEENEAQVSSQLAENVEIKEQEDEKHVLRGVNETGEKEETKEIPTEVEEQKVEVVVIEEVKEISKEQDVTPESNDEIAAHERKETVHEKENKDIDVKSNVENENRQEILENDGVEDEESKEAVVKRSRRKRELQDTVPEEPTTSRISRRKHLTPIVTAEEPVAKSAVSTEVPETKIAPNEDIQISEETIVKTTEEQSLEEVPATSNKEQHEGELSTKQVVKRGRRHKFDVEDTSKETTTNAKETVHATRRGGRHKAVASEISNTEIPKVRNTSRTRKEISSEISNDEELPIVNENIPEVPITEDTATADVLTLIENPKTDEQEEDQLKSIEETPTVVEIPETNADVVISSAVIENQVDALDNVEETSKEIEKPKTDNVVLIEDSSDEDKPTNEKLATSPEEEHSVDSESKDDDKSKKNRMKRIRTASETQQAPVIDVKPAKRRIRQHAEEVHEENQNKANEPHVLEDVAEKSQKTSRRRGGAATHHEHREEEHHEELPTKSRRRRIRHDESEEHHVIENVNEPVKSTEEPSVSEVKITEVNLEPEEVEKTASPQDENQTTDRRVRRKVVNEEHKLEEHETKRKAATKHIEHDNEDNATTSKRRVGRRKHVAEEHEAETVEPVIHPETTHKRRNVGRRKQEQEIEDYQDDVTPEEAKQIETVDIASSRRSIDKKEQNQENNEAQTEIHNVEEEPKHVESIETASKRRHISRKKHEELDDQHIPPKHDTENEQQHIESTSDITTKRRVGRKKHDATEIHHEEDNVANIISADIQSEHQAEHSPEETKKVRGRRKKNHSEDHVEQTTTLHSPETKRKGRKRKESHTDIHDHVSSEMEQPIPDEKSTKEPEIKLDIQSAHTETPQRTAQISRRGRKASTIEHITAESHETEDTPGRRARNVPQRRAATAYHNYDETSDSEVTAKTAKKKTTDSPRKSLEATKTSPTATITTAPIINASPSPSSTTSVTTARGRTRKPTAKVQQFLEEERAKAETPKKRGLLAAATIVDNTTTPQRTPARRGRKPSSTIETEVEGTPITAKGRGRGKHIVASTSHTKEEHVDEHETKPDVVVVEEKEVELNVTPPQAHPAAKGRRGRKAKINEEEHQKSEEPPAKKSPLELESEKQNSSPMVDAPTPPTRVAGRRNAAAAAKARIEEDALAAAAIDPPKRARARKAPAKVSTPVISATPDAEVHSSEVEEEKATKPKSSPLKQEHRLASASTLEDAEDVEDHIESESIDKPANKRVRKAIATGTTDSPTVPPVKRSRKAKTTEETAETDTLGDAKPTRGRGRGRKNVHFNEHEEEPETTATTSSHQNTTDIEAPVVVESSEPVKRGTRTRRK